MAPLPSSPSTGSNVVFAFDGGQGLSYELTGSTDSDAKAIDVAKRQFTVAFQGGFDGCAPTIAYNKGAGISAGNSQGFNLSSSTASGSVTLCKINAVSNPDDFDINLYSSPDVIRRLHSYVFDKITDGRMTRYHSSSVM